MARLSDHLTDRQVKAVFYALRGEKSPFGAVEPYGPLVEALQKLQGSIVFLRHGETPYSEAAVKLATGGLFGLESASDRIFRGYVGDYAHNPNGVVRVTMAAKRKRKGRDWDTPLSKNGLKNTRKFAKSSVGRIFEQFARAKKTVTDVSPQRRAQQTAQQLGFTSDEIYTNANLAEIPIGIEAGKPQDVPGGVRSRVNIYNTQFEGGVNTNDYVRDRVEALVERIIEIADNGSENYVAITHSQLTMVALAALTTLSGGLVQKNGWSGRVDSYKPVVIGPANGLGARKISELSEKTTLKQRMAQRPKAIPKARAAAQHRR